MYFGNWKVYGRKYKLCELPGDKIDVLYYSFFDPTSGECKLSDGYADLERTFAQGAVCSNPNQKSSEPLKGNFYQLQQLKLRFPRLKVMASVGGWTYSLAMHPHMATAASRLKLAKSCVDIIDQYPDVFDGLDIDLEYPCPESAGSCGPGIKGSAQDAPNFTALMQQFRDLLPEPKLLSIATSANEAVIPGMELPNLNKILSHYNIMTYDFVSGSFGDKVTGHQSRVKKPLSPMNLNSSVDPAVQNITPTAGWFTSVEGTIEDYVAQGAQRDKLNVGVAFYGRGFKIGAGNGIYRQSLGALTTGTWETNNFDYSDLKLNYMAGNVAQFDEDAMSPYILDGNSLTLEANGRFITYDSPRSIQAKLDIVKQQGLGGIFAWELTGDTDDHELLNAMNVGKGQMPIAQTNLRQPQNAGTVITDAEILQYIQDHKQTP